VPDYESLVDRPPADREKLAALADRLEALGSERLPDCLERLLLAGAGAGAAALAQRLLDFRDRAADATGAQRALELAFEADPGNSSLLRRLVDEHGKAGRHRETLRVLDAAIAKQEAHDPDLLSLRAGARESLGDDDGALFDLESASVADGRHVDALLELQERVLARQTAKADGRPLPATADAYAIRVVDVLLHANRLERAHLEIERLLARTPAHLEGLERMAALACAEGKWERAVEAYRHLVPIMAGADKETFLRVVLALADACKRTGHPETARESLELAIAKAPESRELMQRLERVCEITGDFTRLANLLLAEADRPENAAERTRLLVRAGTLLLENTGDAAGALRVAGLARVADGENVDAVLLWARAQLGLGRPHEALAALSESASRNRGRRSPLIARVHLETAKARLALDEVVEAFDALKVGFSMDWRNGEMAMLLGLVAIDLDEEKVAERALSGLTAMPTRRDASGEGADPAAQASAFYQLAVLAHFKGDRGKARRLASKAIGIDAGHAKAKALLEHIEPLAGSSATRSGPRAAITPPRS
jgi:tetratricopeptide (TPR) repeat protein